MSVVDSSQQRYSTAWQLAAYLEAEWSDFLFEDGVQDTFPSQKASINPDTDRARPAFYKTIGRLIQECLQRIEFTPTRYCDVGGATGRTMYEVRHFIDSVTEFVLAEPAPILCEWAVKMLLDSNELGRIPTIADWQKPSYTTSRRRPHPIAQAGRDVYVYEASAENVPRPPGYFSLITCLNVIDRHEHPQALVQTLYELLACGGVLVLSSPMDFSERFTPDRERWISDLNLLFSESQWISVGEDNLLYDIRRSRRAWFRYNSQVVAKQKR